MRKITFLMLAMSICIFATAQLQRTKSTTQVRQTTEEVGSKFEKIAPKKFAEKGVNLLMPEFPINGAKNGIDTDTVFANSDYMFPGLTYYNTGDGYMVGHNGQAWTKYASRYTLETPGSLNGLMLFPVVVQDNGGSGTITVKVWSNNNGVPGTELASQVVDMSEMTPPVENNLTPYDITLTTPLANIADFFVGYEISYTTPIDSFANVQMNCQLGTGTSNLFASTADGSWANTDQTFNAATSLYIGARMDLTPTAPSASISATSFGFGNVNVDETATSAAFTLTNAGTDGLTITSVTGVAAPYTTTLDEAINLNAGATHEFTFTFAPTETGAQNAEVVITTNGGTITINLTGTGITAITEPMTGDFETNVYDFDNEFFGWITYDEDGAEVGGIQGVTYPGGNEPAAFIAFNPTAAGIEGEALEVYGAYEGNRYGMSMYATGGVANNDWLIMPAHTVVANDKFTAMVKSATADYGLERYNILVSTTNTEIASFTKISEGEYMEAPATWTPIYYNLEDYVGQTIYVAIQCVSNDAFMFMIDNIEIENIVSETYTVTFDANEGTGTMADQEFSSLTPTANLTLNAFSREGFTFAGWATTATGDVEYTDGASYTATADATLYAVWASTFTVTFDANGGTGTMAAQTFTEGVAANLTPNAFTRENHYFTGWATTATGTVAYSNGASYTATASATLYAVWTEIDPDAMATITLMAGDVWGDGTGYQMLLDADATAYGNEIPVDGPLTSDAMYLASEYTIPEGADAAGTNIVFNNEVTIQVPAGTYDFCITNPSGATIWVANGDNGRKDDYVFEAGKHYEFEAVLDGQNDNIILTITDSNITTYTVTFDANGGEGTMDAQTFTEGEAQALAMNSFTRADYTFEGWATTAAGTAEYADGADYTATADATLYAVWDVVSSIEDDMYNSISVYPNPANSIITVANAENANIVVMNIIGEVVTVINSASSNQTIDISNYAAGTYFVKVDSKTIKFNVVK